MPGPLSGVRILDFGMVVAGASATQHLGDLGAEVLKIEAPTGDMTRSGFLFAAFNRNKKGLCLDLDTPSGKEAFYDLVTISDIVCDNFRPGVMERLGADYETLSRINPRIICYSTSAYGSTGPYCDRPGYDMIAQAEAGIAAHTGFPGDPPVKCGPQVVDLCTGVFAALAMTAALQSRERTGRGERVESSLMNVGVYLMTYQLVSYFRDGEAPPRLGNGHISFAPHGLYKAKDGKYVAISTCWPRIARALDEEWLVDDPRFQDISSRLRHRQELDAIIGRAFLKLNAADWLEVLRLSDIPAAPVNDVEDVARHPQVLAQQMFVQIADKSGDEVRVVNNPLRFGDGVPPDYSPPPGLGEHTDQVLRELLGYSEEKLAVLHRQQDEHFTELEKHTIKKL